MSPFCGLQQLLPVVESGDPSGDRSPPRSWSSGGVGTGRMCEPSAFMRYVAAITPPREKLPKAIVLPSGE